MNNLQFIRTIRLSFLKCLLTSERSNEKLKILHGAISSDLATILKYTDQSRRFNISSLGYGEGKEVKISGRYVDKTVDISIISNGKPIAGIAVKYVISNYMQNSNNYFENMLGETANIRCNKIPYFQIFIIHDKIPYFDNSGVIKNWECINEHNLKKYMKLSEDDIDVYMHTPNKILVYILNIPELENPPCYNKEGYKNFFLNNDFSLIQSSKVFNFSNNVIYNNYEEFIKKVAYSILSL